MAEMSIMDISATVTVGTCCILAHQGVNLSTSPANNVQNILYIIGTLL